MINNHELKLSLDALLECAKFKDYGPNGLQVEGRPQIKRLLTGVTASLALIEEAIQCQADAILVHHGLFWRNQSGVVTGWMKKRLAQLLKHDINLYAYHLPLDAHPTLGNNAQLARTLGFVPSGSFGEQNLGMMGHAKTPLVNLRAFAQSVESVLHKPPLMVCPKELDMDMDLEELWGPNPLVAWCTGGAQGYFESAIEAGARIFITGEISEPQAHLARECGVVFVACGHHASERGGAKALGEYLAQTHGLDHQFIDIDNPA
jgi:dinuclear metal center YbgI/SA1388 family protein